VPSQNRLPVALLAATPYLDSFRYYIASADFARKEAWRSHSDCVLTNNGVSQIGLYPVVSRVTPTGKRVKKQGKEGETHPVKFNRTVAIVWMCVVDG
jgi:hypothetical protein